MAEISGHRRLHWSRASPATRLEDKQLPEPQEIHLKVLRHIEENPEVTQRELASELGVSLGKANYCLKALMDKGFIKARNFHNSNNKRAYLYKLTPIGIEAKARISVAFLRRKMDEYEHLKEEIEQLQTEVNGEL
jgi:EPS-associated MarR family transcriptional regulator